MRNIFLAITFILITSSIFGQAEKATYKIVADKFENNYNQSNYDSIFVMFSNEMQNALPIDKTKEFLVGLKSQAGRIIKREFVKYDKGTYASYKTNFENSVWDLNISIDNNSKINGLFVKPFKPDNLPKIERNKTLLILPFKGAWNVVWGGDTKELNYHVESEAQKNAFDILIFDKAGKSYKTDSKTNEDYYAFGKELIAPCDGEVVLVINGVKDNKLGEMNSIDVTGNTVVIKTINNEYLYFCHFKNQSIRIKEGEKIKQGQVLGLCGNSGHSSEPHLHFHIQNVKDMNIATGVKCYFEKIIVNGKIKTDYSPIQNDIISNVK
jgi:murein DD-endopeptidase MepM/ murein hydrolase activator NlpD